MSDNPVDPNAPVTITVKDLRAMQRMSTTITELQQRIQELSSLNNSSVPVPASPYREPRVSDPEHFDGTRHQLSSFVAQLQLVIQAQPSRFPTERQMVIFAASFLRGTAFKWFEPFLKQSPPPVLLDSFSNFVAELQSAFGDPDEAATAQRQLCLLRQTHSASVYAADFRRLSLLTEWNDAALCYQFYQGLKGDVKDELAKVDRPKTLTGLVDLAVKIDNRIHERLLEKRIQSQYRPAPRHSAPTPPVPVPTLSPQAMEIDGTNNPRGPRQALTAQERQRRIDNRLCLYCGQADHIIANCPVRPPSRKQAILSATAAVATVVAADSENIHAQRL